MSGAPRPAPGRPRGRWGRFWAAVALPLAVILLSVALGAAIILASQLLVPGQPFNPFLPVIAYEALIEGAIGSPDAIVSTLVNTTPLVFGGLAVGFAFKAGLFNIGVQGQFLMGALGAVIVGVWVSDLPPIVAIPLATLAGIAAGAAWGFIPGFLKAISGAHEVVSTIMLNYIAVAILAAAVSGPLKVPKSPSPVTYDVGNAALPIIIPPIGHLGIPLAVLAALFVHWLLLRTIWGFQVRAVGANSDAARYAGMRPRLVTVATMSFSGALGGMAGSCVLLGVTHTMTSSFGTTVGFDSIAVALLARSNPLMTLLSALLFGSMRAGAGLMQIRAEIPVELVDVLQAVILLFLVAAPVLRRLLRIRPPADTPEASATPNAAPHPGAVI